MPNPDALSPNDVLFSEARPMLNALQALFGRMDGAYEETANALGFRCGGCADNCCLTLFFHHTLAEFLYLREGFLRLDKDLQSRLTDGAARVNDAVARIKAEGRTPRVMCPLNLEGRCVLYARRPMICRLHGIPHVFRHPSGKVLSGPGCHVCESLPRAPGRMTLDRTSFYRDMALLEQRLRAATGFCGKIRMTVAEMVGKMTN